MVQTVKENKLSSGQGKSAELVRKLYAIVGHPSRNDFVKVLRLNFSKGFNITSEEFNRIEIIWG